MSKSPPALELLERRAALLASRDRSPEDHAELDRLTAELGSLLAGAAHTRRLELEDPARPGSLARRMAASEPVNPIAGEADLQDRFDRDRRVFVLEHPVLAGRPMNIVWVALCRGIPARLSEILDPTAPCTEPGEADTAVLYSIWNAEPGLVGLGRGVELIDGAVELLGGELPGLITFVTLSPVPGFRHFAERDASADGTEAPTELARQCARYLTTCRGGRPIDPVARFHMGNGARLLRVSSSADPSPQGMARSWGMMANYRYVPEDRAANRASLAAGRPALGEQVSSLLAT